MTHVIAYHVSDQFAVFSVQLFDTTAGSICGAASASADNARQQHQTEPRKVPFEPDVDELFSVTSSIPHQQAAISKMTSILAHSHEFNAKLLRLLVAKFKNDPVEHVSQISSALDRCIERNALSSASAGDTVGLVKCLRRSFEEKSPALHAVGLKLAANLALSLPRREYAHIWNEIADRLFRRIKEENRQSDGESTSSVLAQCFVTCAAVLHSAAPVCRHTIRQPNILKLTESLARIAVQHLPDSLPMLWACCAIAPRELRFVLTKLSEHIRTRLFFHHDPAVRHSAASLFVHLIIAVPEKNRADTMRSCVTSLCDGLEDVNSILDVFTAQSSPSGPLPSTALDINGDPSPTLPTLHQVELATHDVDKLNAFFDSLCMAVSCSLTTHVTSADPIQIPLPRLVSILSSVVAPRSIDAYAIGFPDGKLEPDDALSLAHVATVTGLKTLRSILQTVSRSVLLPLHQVFCDAALVNLKALVLQARSDAGLFATSLLRKLIYELIADAVVTLGASVIDAVADLLRRLLEREIGVLVVNVLAKQQDNFLFLSGSDIISSAPANGDGTKKHRKRIRAEREAAVANVGQEQYHITTIADEVSLNTIRGTLDAGMRAVKACFDCRGFTDAKTCSHLRNIEKLLLECIERGIVSDSVISAASASSAGGGSNRQEAYISPLFEPCFREVSNIPMSAMNSMAVRRAATSGRAVCGTMLYPKGPPTRPSTVGASPSLYDSIAGYELPIAMPVTTEVIQTPQQPTSLDPPATVPKTSPESSPTLAASQENGKAKKKRRVSKQQEPNQNGPSTAAESVRVIKGINTKFNNFVFNVRRDGSTDKDSSTDSAKRLTISDLHKANAGEHVKSNGIGTEQPSDDNSNSDRDDVVMKSVEEGNETSSARKDDCIQPKSSSAAAPSPLTISTESAYDASAASVAPVTPGSAAPAATPARTPILPVKESISNIGALVSNEKNGKESSSDDDKIESQNENDVLQDRNQSSDDGNEHREDVAESNDAQMEEAPSHDENVNGNEHEEDVADSNDDAQMKEAPTHDENVNDQSNKSVTQIEQAEHTNGQIESQVEPKTPSDGNLNQQKDVSNEDEEENLAHTKKVEAGQEEEQGPNDLPKTDEDGAANQNEVSKDVTEQNGKDDAHEPDISSTEVEGMSKAAADEGGSGEGETGEGEQVTSISTSPEEDKKKESAEKEKNENDGHLHRVNTAQEYNNAPPSITDADQADVVNEDENQVEKDIATAPNKESDNPDEHAKLAESNGGQHMKSAALHSEDTNDQCSEPSMRDEQLEKGYGRSESSSKDLCLSKNGSTNQLTDIDAEQSPKHIEKAEGGQKEPEEEPEVVPQMEDGVVEKQDVISGDTQEPNKNVDTEKPEGESMGVGESEEQDANDNQAKHEDKNMGGDTMVENVDEEDEDVVFVTFSAAPMPHSPEHIGIKSETAGTRNNSHAVEVEEVVSNEIDCDEAIADANGRTDAKTNTSEKDPGIEIVEDTKTMQGSANGHVKPVRVNLIEDSEQNNGEKERNMKAIASQSEANANDDSEKKTADGSNDHSGEDELIESICFDAPDHQPQSDDPNGQ